jgi:hypothetical protein
LCNKFILIISFSFIMYFLYFIIFCILLCTGKYYIVNLSIRSGGHSIHINTSFGESVKFVLCIFHSLSPWTVIQNSFSDIIFLLNCKSLPVSSLICCVHRWTPAGLRILFQQLQSFCCCFMLFSDRLIFTKETILLLWLIKICILEDFCPSVSFLCALYSPELY